MKGKLLWCTTAVLILIVVVTGVSWLFRGDSKKDDRSEPAPPIVEVGRDKLPNPPPAPKSVANPDRVRQNLRPGKTYVTSTKGTLHVRGEDKDWGLRRVVTINYAFEAHVDREIESNDGKIIVEVRHFRDLRSLKMTCELEDIRLDLGSDADPFLAGVALLNPKAGFLVAGTIKAIDGSSLAPVIKALRLSGVPPEKLAGLDQSLIAFASVDRLSGKSVRLTYEDGKGVIKVQAVKGEITPAERDFHFASALLSDSLIVPDVDIKIGTRWTVDGSSFANMIDPSLRARPAGELDMERARDHIVTGETCRHLKLVKGGRINLADPDPKVGSNGYFDPEGSLYFSPKNQIIVKGVLHGKGKLERFSKDHLLFESRMRQLPEIHIRYECRVEDTPKNKEP